MHWQNELIQERRNSWCIFSMAGTWSHPATGTKLVKTQDEDGGRLRWWTLQWNNAVMIAKNISSFYKKGWGGDWWQLSSRANRVKEKQRGAKRKRRKQQDTWKREAMKLEITSVYQTMKILSFNMSIFAHHISISAEKRSSLQLKIWTFVIHVLIFLLNLESCPSSTGVLLLSAVLHELHLLHFSLIWHAWLPTL